MWFHVRFRYNPPLLRLVGSSGQMKNISPWQLGMVTLAAALCCTACGNSPTAEAGDTQEPVSAGNYFVGQNPIYAYLDSGSGGSWVFTTVTESDLPPASGYLVRLNDLAPAFDTRLAECTPQAYPLNHKCSMTQPFRKTEVGVIGRIISGGIAAGTAGKVTDVSRNYKTVFDEATFNQAVDEALVNTGLDSERQQFIAMLEEYASVAKAATQELEALASRANDTYHDTSSIAVSVQPELLGLTVYYTNDIDFRSLIEISPQQEGSLSATTLDAKPLLPCDARSCIANARNALLSLKTDVMNVKSTILSAGAQDSATYDIRCPATTHNGYLFTLSCPEQVQRDASGAMLVPLTMNILSRDFESLYPDFSLADERLRVSIAGTTVMFSNLTENYLAVMAQTIYYNSQVKTSSTRINLAPGVSDSRQISEFISPAIDIESSYRQMTPDKAAAASFRFGIATKYQVAGQPEEFTLYDQQHFNVGCAIDNRIEFGACIAAEPAEEELQEPAMLDEIEQVLDESSPDEQEDQT